MKNENYEANNLLGRSNDSCRHVQVDVELLDDFALVEQSVNLVLEIFLEKITRSLEGIRTRDTGCFSHHVQPFLR